MNNMYKKTSYLENKMQNMHIYSQKVDVFIIYLYSIIADNMLSSFYRLVQFHIQYLHLMATNS